MNPGLEFFLFGESVSGKMDKEKYRNCLYIEIMPEESRNAAFYEKRGFRVMEDVIAMRLCNFSKRS